MSTITLYNGQHVQTTEALVAAFEKATGIKVEVRNDDEDVFDDRDRRRRGRARRPTSSTPRTRRRSSTCRTRACSPRSTASTLARTPAKYDSPQGDWVGVSARVSVLIYNPSLISQEPLPTRVLELADPRYRGKLAFAAGETDFQPIVTSVLRTYGKAATLSG